MLTDTVPEDCDGCGSQLLGPQRVLVNSGGVLGDSIVHAPSFPSALKDANLNCTAQPLPSGALACAVKSRSLLKLSVAAAMSSLPKPALTPAPNPAVASTSATAETFALGFETLRCGTHTSTGGVPTVEAPALRCALTSALNPP